MTPSAHVAHVDAPNTISTSVARSPRNHEPMFPIVRVGTAFCQTFQGITPRSNGTREWNFRSLVSCP
jgi:hypothetical protein